MFCFCVVFFEIYLSFQNVNNSIIIYLMAFYARGVSLDWRNQKSRRAAFKLEASVSEFNTNSDINLRGQSQTFVKTFINSQFERKKNPKVFKNLKLFINSWQIIKGWKKMSPWCDYSGILMFQLARTPASAFLFFFGSTFCFMAAHALFLLSQHCPFIRHVQMPWSFGGNGYSRHTLTRYSIP